MNDNFRVSRDDLIYIFEQIENREDKEQLRSILADIIHDQFNNKEPQRVLFCGVDYQPIWHYLWQVCVIDGLLPSQWHTKNIQEAEMVDACLQHMVCSGDDLRRKHIPHHIVFMADIDEMGLEAQEALGKAMDDKIYTTHMTETSVCMNDVCFIMTTKKSVHEMKREMHKRLIDPITNVWGAD